MRYLLLLACLPLAACGGQAPVDTGKLKPPAKWLMSRPCKLPPYPQQDGDPVIRAEYDAALRKCAASRADQTRGLQRYTRTVVKQANR